MSNIFTIKQGDLSPPIIATLYNGDGSLLDLTDAVEVRFRLTDDTGEIVIDEAATVVDVAGVVRYDWVVGDTAAAGNYTREWQVTLPSGLPVSVPNDRPGNPVIMAPQLA